MKQFASALILVKAIGVVSMILIALTGCAHATNQRLASESDGGYTQYQQPPPNPPAVSANGETLAIAQFQWWADGDLHEQLVTDPSLVPIPSIQINRDSIDFVISSGVRPYQLVLTLFDQLGADGRPTTDTGEQIDCLKSVRCLLEFSARETKLRINGIPSDRVAMLHVAYLDLSSSESPELSSPQTSSASWTLSTSSRQ